VIPTAGALKRKDLNCYSYSSRLSGWRLNIAHGMKPLPRSAPV
jgi:hypothetical protein